MKNRLLIIGYDQSLEQDQEKKCLNDGLCSYFLEVWEMWQKSYTEEMIIP